MQTKVLLSSEAHQLIHSGRFFTQPLPCERGETHFGRDRSCAAAARPPRSRALHRLVRIIICNSAPIEMQESVSGAALLQCLRNISHEIRGEAPWQTEQCSHVKGCRRGLQHWRLPCMLCVGRPQPAHPIWCNHKLTFRCTRPYGAYGPGPLLAQTGGRTAYKAPSGLTAPHFSASTCPAHTQTAMWAPPWRR